MGWIIPRNWPRFTVGMVIFTVGMMLMPDPHGWRECLGIVLTLVGFSFARGGE